MKYRIVKKADWPKNKGYREFYKIQSKKTFFSFWEDCFPQEFRTIEEADKHLNHVHFLRQRRTNVTVKEIKIGT